MYGMYKMSIAHSLSQLVICVVRAASSVYVNDTVGIVGEPMPCERTRT